jgi:hypothetical protein
VTGHTFHGHADSAAHATPNSRQQNVHAHHVVADSLRDEVDHSDAKKPQSRSRSASPASSLFVSTSTPSLSAPTNHVNPSPLPVKPEFTRQGSGVRSSGIAISSAGLSVIGSGSGGSTVPAGSPYGPPLHRSSRSSSGHSDPRESADDSADSAGFRNTRQSSKKNMVFS